MAGGDLTINLDIASIREMHADLTKELEAKLQVAAAAIATQAHAHILEQANTRLKTRRETFVEALEFEQVDSHTWAITVPQKALWIENGMPPHNMLEDLLKSPKAKTAKDGCVLNPRNKVLTSLGYKKIKDIKAGDMILTHSGKFREVKEVLIQKAGVGTEYVIIKPYSATSSINPNKKNCDLTLPSLSLTIDHLVLTPGGWQPAGELKKGDLIATPADLKRLCQFCGAPLPINAFVAKYCLNNSCSRKAACKEGRLLGAIKPEDRRANGLIGNTAARASGVFDRPDWGARNPEHLKIMRKSSAKAMREKVSSGEWEPEEKFSQFLYSEGLIEDVDFIREYPILTDRIVSAGGGRTRKSTLFCDFFFPKLKLVIELDGKHWHDNAEAKERDVAKDKAVSVRGWFMARIASHKIYQEGRDLAKAVSVWSKNHSGELGIAWVRVGKIKRGVVNRPDHVYAKKYDLCLDAEEHSFCCETVFIHNSKYLVIPFKHNKGPTQQTPVQAGLLDTIKQHLKARQIPYGKIEKNPDGSPKVGLLHKFDIHEPHPKADHHSNHILEGIRVYQNAKKNPDGSPRMNKHGHQMVSREIMTFRVASSKQQNSGKWFHPGFEAMGFLDEAYTWAVKLWEDEIQPSILKGLGIT